MKRDGESIHPLTVYELVSDGCTLAEGGRDFDRGELTCCELVSELDSERRGGWLKREVCEDGR